MPRKIVSALCLAAIAATANAAPGHYLGKQLPALPFGLEGTVVLVSDQGHAVVSGVDIENGTTSYFFWTSENGYVALLQPDGEAPLHVRALDDHDRVVATTRENTGMVWTPTAVVPLKVPAGFHSIEPAWIDDKGVIVGALYRNDTMRGFHQAGRGPAVVDGPLFTIDRFVNDHGVVLRDTYAGPASVGSPATASSLLSGGVETPIVVPGGGNLQASGLNDAGEVSLSQPQIGYWSAATGFLPIGLAFGGAVGVSATGTVVAYGAKDGITPRAPFVWTATDGLVPLADLLVPGSDDLGTFHVACVSAGGRIGGGSAQGPVLLLPRP